MASPLAARSDPAEELRTTALRLFVETSYAGASLQQIADAAGYSKSSVLYHFASKEALLEASLAPAVERLGTLLENILGRIADEDQRAVFVEEFIDYLLEYRYEAHIIINQGQTLAGVPTLDRARKYIVYLSELFMSDLPSTQQRVRLGVALAGAAYVLATTASDANGAALEAAGDIRHALIDVVAELLVPLPPGNPGALVDMHTLAQPAHSLPAHPQPAHTQPAHTQPAHTQPLHSEPTLS